MWFKATLNLSKKVRLIRAKARWVPHLVSSCPDHIRANTFQSRGYSGLSSSYAAFPWQGKTGLPKKGSSVSGHVAYSSTPCACAEQRFLAASCLSPRASWLTHNHWKVGVCASWRLPPQCRRMDFFCDFRLGWSHLTSFFPLWVTAEMTQQTEEEDMQKRKRSQERGVEMQNVNRWRKRVMMAMMMIMLKMMPIMVHKTTPTVQHLK